jgi:hypothetical protein
MLINVKTLLVPLQFIGNAISGLFGPRKLLEDSSGFKLNEDGSFKLLE